MTLTIELPADKAAILLDGASQRGLTPERWLEELVIPQIQPPIEDPNDLPFEEWKARFDHFLAGLDRNTPVLSDYDMSRESIYADRGL